MPDSRLFYRFQYSPVVTMFFFLVLLSIISCMNAWFCMHDQIQRCMPRTQQPMWNVRCVLSPLLLLAPPSSSVSCTHSRVIGERAAVAALPGRPLPQHRATRPAGEQFILLSAWFLPAFRPPPPLQTAREERKAKGEVSGRLSAGFVRGMRSRIASGERIWLWRRTSGCEGRDTEEEDVLFQRSRKVRRRLLVSFPLGS